MMGRGTRAAVVALTLGSCMAALAHRPPYGADDAAAVVADTCAPTPMTDTNTPALAALNALWDGSDYREPFLLGRVQEGVTTRFGTGSQAVFRSGRAGITIQLDDTYGWNRSRTLKHVARSLASLPSALMQRLPPTNVELTEFEVYSSQPYAYSRWCSGGEDGEYDPATGRPVDVCYGVVMPSRTFQSAAGQNPVPRAGFEVTLVHEFAHVLDFFSRISPTAAGSEALSGQRWETAIEESPCAVSRYATLSSGEDFAESVIAWFAYYAGRQGRLGASARGALRERLGKRFGVLNKLMHDRFDYGD